MDTDWTITSLFAATRAVHFGACLLLFGAWVFDRLVAGPLERSPHLQKLWKMIARALVASALPLILLSGTGWLAFNAINMSGLPPGLALRGEVLRIVLTETHFGFLWEVRAAIFLAALVTSISALVTSSSRLRAPLVWIALVPAGALGGSLAWAGHGLTGEHATSHLVADVIHIVIAGLWPVGLLPFALFLWRLRRQTSPTPIPSIVRRFSAMSLVSVALLILTGLMNSWILVGSVSNLFSTGYGRVLLAKILLFLAAIGIGAVNLLHIKPRLAVDLLEGTSEPDAAAVRRLQINMVIELGLAFVIFLLVGFLGLLPPALEAMLHHHHHHG